MIGTLLDEWRQRGPVWWAGHEYGFVMEDGRPIMLTDWQRSALQAWWEHRETVSTLALSNVKKTGKTTLDGVLTAWRWLVLPGEHLCVANDRDQAEGRQFRMIAKMCKRHPLLKRYVANTKKLLTFEPTGSTLEAIEVDAPGRAGSNHATTSHTETWGILHEGSIRAFEELTPPPDKTFGLPALRICDSYAGWLTESQTWHDLVDRGLSGERVGGDWPIYKANGLLLFHMDGEEAQRRCFRGTAEERETYYAEQAATLRAAAYSRLHLNQRTSGESRFVDPAQWEALVSAGCRPVAPGDDRPLWLGADAGTKRDSVALVGCTWNKELERVELAYVREWKPKFLPKLVGGVDLDETLAAEIEKLRREHNVREVVFDPWQLASIANRLQKAGVQMVEMPQSAQRTQADQALYDAITAGTLATFESPALGRAIRKACGKETVRGLRLEKRPGDDLVVALSMAHFRALQKGPRRGVFVAALDLSPEQLEERELRRRDSGLLPAGEHERGQRWRRLI